MKMEVQDYMLEFVNLLERAAADHVWIMPYACIQNGTKKAGISIGNVDTKEEIRIQIFEETSQE